MTTLKQKLDIGLLPNNLAREQQKRDIQIFKEWLQQKQKDLENNPEYMEDMNKIYLVQIIQRYIDKEFLEELR